jgi:hypothetical protein
MKSAAPARRNPIKQHRHQQPDQQPFALYQLINRDVSFD